MTHKNKKSATVAQLSQIWLTDIRISVKESTYTRYHRAVHKYIIPHLGSLPVADIDSFAVNRFSENLLTSGGLRNGSLSAKTVTDVLCVLKSILKFGRLSGYPCADTSGIRYPQRKGRNIRVLSSDSRTILETVVLNRNDSTSIGILLSLFMGLRIGELCGLKWGDIDFRGQVLSVRRTVERISDLNPDSAMLTKVIVSEPKTSSSIRVIPLPAFISEILQEQALTPEKYLLTGADTPVEPHCFYNRYRRFMRDHRLEGYSFHALRHTFATRCVEVGFDTKSLSEILGHTNISTTLAFYVHPSMEQKRAQMEKLTPQLTSAE